MEELKNSLREAMCSRRSTRRYLKDAVPQDLMMEVVEAGRMAPSGMNRQNTHFIIITDPDKFLQLREIMTGVLANVTLQEGMPPPFIGLVNKAKEGTTVDVSYGAPVLILTANKKDNKNAIADCACALQNMMLMATACGLGCCWISQYAALGETPALRSALEALGLQEDEGIYGGLALGYAENLQTSPLPRTGHPVTQV